MSTPSSTARTRTLWGPLADRYSADKPRKLLALDGGGIRGIITLHFLQKIEKLLSQSTGRRGDFRLCEFFDYIGGTSTGAIIAAGLARGISTTELLQFYRVVGSRMWLRASAFERLKHKYRVEPLREELQKVFGRETTLAPSDLRCLLLIVTRNHTTDSPWPVSSNPLARFNDPDLPDCNLRIPLWQLVRASTAAPTFFGPERVILDPSRPTREAVFVDGGTTPYNNPSFLLYKMATAEPYRLNWPTGERRLLLVSIGTGSSSFPIAKAEANVLSTAINTLHVLTRGSVVEQDISCRIVGRCVHGEPIDLELGDLIPRDAAGRMVPLAHDLGRSFLYARYNVDLAEAAKVQGLSSKDLREVRRLDSFDRLADLERIGEAYARTISLDHFGPFAAL